MNIRNNIDNAVESLGSLAEGLRKRKVTLIAAGCIALAGCETTGSSRIPGVGTVNPQNMGTIVGGALGAAAGTIALEALDEDPSAAARTAAAVGGAAVGAGIGSGFNQDCVAETTARTTDEFGRRVEDTSTTKTRCIDSGPAGDFNGQPGIPRRATNPYAFDPTPGG